jgi:antitoxin component of RelBE/YafQ-DinJ toxin-antitoxin module
MTRSRSRAEQTVSDVIHLALAQAAAAARVPIEALLEALDHARAESA